MYNIYIILKDSQILGTDLTHERIGKQKRILRALTLLRYYFGGEEGSAVEISTYESHRIFVDAFVCH